MMGLPSLDSIHQGSKINTILCLNPNVNYASFALKLPHRDITPRPSSITTSI